MANAPAVPAPRERSAAPATGEPSEADGSTHVVRPGECLWSIAAQRLGPSAADARVAAYVQRLWETNAGRIATGTPNLIYPGQQLRLP